MVFLKEKRPRNNRKVLMGIVRTMEVVPKNEKKEHKKELYRHKKMQYYITKSRTTELVYFSSLFLPSPIITS